MDFNQNDTQHFTSKARVRSRHMIPMEILAFLTLMVAGYSGAFGQGYLNSFLEADQQALWWGLALMPLAGAGVLASSAEWWIGHSWENGLLRLSIATRMWLSGLAWVMWMYTLYVMALLPQGPISSMVLSACFVGPFHLWSWWVNYRVLCALDPKLKTEKLGRRLETTRDRW